MKCPKCNYTSFDHYQSCAKCKRDLTLTREKMNFFSFVDCEPLFTGFTGSSSSAQPASESFDDAHATSTSTMEFQGNGGFGMGATAGPPDIPDDGDEVSFDFEDDFAFGDDDLADTGAGQTLTENDTIDGDMTFTFGEVRDEIPLDEQGPSTPGSAQGFMEEDETTDGDIEFDFNLEVEEKQAVTSLSEDDITTANFDADDVLPDEEKASVTAELEKSVSNLVDDMDDSDSGGSYEIGIDDMGKQTAELEVLDLDLDLDKDDK